MPTGRLFLNEHGADQADYSYPATADFTILKGPNHTIHKICGPGAPSTDYNNAPLGSEYTDMTNYELYIMTAAATWTKVGTQS